MNLNSHTTKKRRRWSLDQQFTDEGDLLKKVMEYFEPQQRDGIMILKIRDRYAKGYSDLFINVRGVFVVAELKDDIGVASQHQLDFIEDMAKCGAIGGVCRTVNDVIRLVEAAKRRATWWT